eukprot:XP_002259824.1 hypothetical protein, conserved in Plasmodium species [Plasmodium knowlesi strain H]
MFYNFSFFRYEHISPKGRSFVQKILLSDIRLFWKSPPLEDIPTIYDFWKKNAFKRYILNNISKFVVKEDIYSRRKSARYNSLFFYFDIMEEGSIKYAQYFAIMKKLGLIDSNVIIPFDIIACLLNGFIKIDKRIVLKFFKKVDYDNEGIITKKKLYKFYSIKSRNEISSSDKRNFSKLL